MTHPEFESNCHLPTSLPRMAKAPQNLTVIKYAIRSFIHLVKHIRYSSWTTATTGINKWNLWHLLYEIEFKSNLHHTRCITPKRVTSLREPISRVIAPGQRSFFPRNVAAVASHWQHCIRFNRPEIWISDHPLQKQPRYRLTNWPIRN